MENKFNSDYSIRLATLRSLGGDVSKHYNSVYDIDLAILEVIQGGGGGGISYEEIKEKLATLGVDEIVFNKDGQTVTLDYDKVLQIGQGGGEKTYVLDNMSGDECAALYNELKSDNVDLSQYKICRKFNTSDDSKFTVATTIVQNAGNEVSFIFWTTKNDGGYGRRYLNIRLGNNGNWYTDRNLSIASIDDDIKNKFKRLDLTIDENGNPINDPKDNFRVLIEGRDSENRQTTNIIAKVNGYDNDSSVSNARVIVDKTKTTSGLREFSIDVLTKDGLFNGIYVFGTAVYGDKQQDFKDFVGDQSYTKWWALKSWTKIGDSAAGGGDYVSVASLDEISTPKEGMVAYVRSRELTITGKEVEFQHYNFWEHWNNVHFNINISDSTGDRVLRCGYNFNAFFNSNGEFILDHIIDWNRTDIWFQADDIRFQVKQIEDGGNPDANKIVMFIECPADAVITYSCDWEQREDFSMTTTDSSATETIDGHSYIYQDEKWSDYIKYYKIDNMGKADIVRLVETIFMKGAEGYTLAWEIDDGRIIQTSSIQLQQNENRIIAYHINSFWECKIHIYSDGSYNTEVRDIGTSWRNFNHFINLNGQPVQDIETWIYYYFDEYKNIYDYGGNEKTFFLIMRDDDGNNVNQCRFNPSVTGRQYTDTGFTEFGAIIQVSNGDLYNGRWVTFYEDSEENWAAIRAYTGDPDYQHHWALKSFTKIG